MPVEEARLLAAVKRILGPQVERLRMPPVKRGEENDPFSAEAKIGTPVRPFPRFLRCVRCQLLAEFDSGLFQLKENLFRPELTRFVHKNCEKGNKSEAVPARFLLACRAGHLDDFPWRWFVHGGPTSCNGTLRFFETGASLQTENLRVKCDGCDASPPPLSQAFGKAGEKNLPGCRGRHPHLGIYEDDCKEKPRTVLLGATNSWFSSSVSVLAIPFAKDQVGQLVADGWEYFTDLESELEVKITQKALIKSNSLPGIGDFQPREIWEAIERKRSGGDGEEEIVTEADIKRPEWRVLTDPSAPNDWPHFLKTEAAVPSGFENIIDQVVLLERLREVNALVGFTRVEAPEESDDPKDRPELASLCKGKPTWVPVSEVHGEGIFIRFNEAAIRAWESTTTVSERDRDLREGHKGWRNARRLDPSVGYPVIRYSMIHTLSHLLIRELALECGYNAASIRERVYADNDADDRMAGLLLYTAAADSDGTLGGLVDLGRPENLGPIILQALKRSTICSSDPLCSEHEAANDRSLHAASCHACGFVAETSCERGNRYLDRALVVPTFDCVDAAIFSKHVES